MNIPLVSSHITALQTSKSSPSSHLNTVSVTLQRPLVVPGLEVPQLDGGILGCGDHVGKYRMEDDPVMMDR